nr:DNA recombination protein RmuC [Pseudomarimonas arenosa]
MLEQAIAQREQRLQDEQSKSTRLAAELAELRGRGEELQRASEQKLALLNEAEQRLRESFKQLAQQVFEERAEKLGQQSQHQIGGLLEPLRMQLQQFREAMASTQAAEQRERGILAAEIRSLKQLNQQISEDAINLTRALKGDSKVQGAWGELVLERVLEASGLHRDREYVMQASFKDDDGALQRPDAIVHLPDGKDLVIDAKVSLVAYERSVAAVTEDERHQALKEHIQSLRRHIDSLSSRAYTDLSELRTLDFVLMFVPVEAAFVEAVRHEGELYLYALRRNVALVSPSTMLATLRTVAHLWRMEQRNVNAIEIADRAAKLYDHFASLVGELQQVGQQLEKAQRAQSSALRRLTDGGKGSIVLQLNSLIELGVQTRKQLPAELVHRAASGQADEAGKEKAHSSANEDPR